MSKNVLRHGLSLVALLGSVSLAEALPRNANGTVINGTASIVDTSGTTTTINQTSDIAEINWSNFDIASGETVQFNVPRTASLTVNRVLSGTESTIAGTINSNGQFYLINEHGMRFMNGAQVDVQAFVASTIDTFNSQADANQYAEITFDSARIRASSNPDSYLIVIAPFIGFYNTAQRLTVEGARDTDIISANRATINVAGADNNITYDVPDAQPDVVVPGGKKLGIEGIATSGSFLEVVGYYDTDFIAKAVSVAQNIDAVINLDGRALNGSSDYATFGGYHSVAANPTIADWSVDLYSAGHISVQGQTKLSALAYVALPDGTPVSLPASLRLRAEKNLFMDSFHSGANNLHIEAGNNLILNKMVAPPAATIEPLFLRGVYGTRTIKLGSGTLSVENSEINVGALAGIETYAAGSFGHVNKEWVGIDYFDGSDYADMSAGAIDAPVAVTTILEADQIDINTDIDYTGTATARDFKANYGYDFAPGVSIKYFYDPGAGSEETAPLTLKATGDININANINTASMGDVNLVLDGDYNLAATKSVATGSNLLNISALTVDSGSAPDPTPEPVDPTSTVGDLIENITPETVEVVKGLFFDDFGDGSKEAVDQVVSLDAFDSNVLKNKSLNTKLEAPSVADTQEGFMKFTAADCIDNVCTVLDEENTMLRVEMKLLKQERSFFARLVDKAVNLKGMTDIVRF